MTRQNSQEQFRFVPASRLTLSPLNVRKTDSDAGIEELAALIEAEGVLQNLVGYEEKRQGTKRSSTYAIVAGGRRWRAIQLLLKQRRIEPTYEVPLLVTTPEQALAISMTENSGRKEMHPADQFEAFKALVDSGRSCEDVAVAFGVSPLVVQRRLKLANVDPLFLQLYREGKASLEHLMALALTDDHEKQRQVWNTLEPYERRPENLRRLLTENEVDARDPIARFVGLKAYTEAGGAIRRDLFSEDDGGYLTDPALLTRLATEKLQTYAAEVKQEGHAWVDARLTLDYAERAAWGHVQTTLREPTVEEKARLEAIERERSDLHEQAADLPDDSDELLTLELRMDALDEEADKIEQQRRVPNPEQQALAGALISIGRDGKVHIERGLLRPEDAKRFARKRNATKPANGAAPPRTHSDALMRRLSAHRTCALQACLAAKPDIALVALTHHLALRTFFAHEADHSTLQIKTLDVTLHQHADDLNESRAHAALQALRERLQAQLPSEPSALFAWLLAQPTERVLELLAFCVALTLDAVQSSEGAHPADALAEAVGLDMRAWWTPTVSGYLGRIPKARILDAVREAVSPDVAASLRDLDKTRLAEAAERRLANTGWLPLPLRPTAPVDSAR